MLPPFQVVPIHECRLATLASTFELPFVIKDNTFDVHIT